MIKINFEDFSLTLQKIESTSSQNKMVEILSNLFKNLKENEIDKISYLLLGRVSPCHEDINLGLSEKTIQFAISLASGATKEEVGAEIRIIGDIGKVASQMIESRENPFKDH